MRASYRLQLTSSMNTIHHGLAFVVALAASVGCGVFAILLDPVGVIAYREYSVGAGAAFGGLAFVAALLLWFGPCRGRSPERSWLCWWAAICSIAVCGLLLAAAIMRVIAR